MSTTKVDSKKRVVLPSGRPGDVYDVQCRDERHVLLVRLERPSHEHATSERACLEAMDTAPLLPTMTWNALRQVTREL